MKFIKTVTDCNGNEHDLMVRDGDVWWGNKKFSTVTDAKFYVDAQFNYYIKDGVVYWKSNDAVVPIDSAKEYDIPINGSLQEIARDREIQNLIVISKNKRYTDEEKSEMRSVFGEGETVVNVLTGEKIKL